MLFLVQADEQLHNFLTGFTVEVAGRFIGHDDLGIVDEGAGNRHTLLLTAGHFLRLMIDTGAEADHFQSLLGAFVRVRLVLGVEQRELDIFQRGQAREQVEALEHEADFAVADLGQLGVAHL